MRAGYLLRIAGAHFAAGALQRCEELGMDQGRLGRWVLHTMGVITN